jgi:nitrogen fixation protein FixH
MMNRIPFNWGTAITLVYTCFAAATTGFVAFAMSRPVELVTPEYYAESLRQNERMQAERNAQALRPGAAVAQSAGRLVAVSLPIDHARNARGTVTLYRPSDSTADRLFQLAVDSNGRQYLSLDGLATGRWIVQVRWSDGDRDYYVEQPVFAK